METHAYVTPRVVLENAQSHRNAVLLDVTPVDDNSSTYPAVVASDKKHSHRSVANTDYVEGMSGAEESPAISGSDIIRKAAQFMYGDFADKSQVQQFEYTLCLNDETENVAQHHRLETSLGPMYSIPDIQVHANTAIEETHADTHIYEQIGTMSCTQNSSKCDISDYYEQYSPTTAKTLINTLFLPGHRICKQCAATQSSPVYSDHLIYFKQPLRAKETVLFQFEDSLCFKYDRVPSNAKLEERDQDYMPVCSLAKTNSSGVFYFNSPPEDVFDLKLTLEPSILLVNDTFQETENTQLYHRNSRDYYSRVSRTGCAPMVFHSNQNNTMNPLTNTGYETDLRNWMNYRNDVVKLRGSKQDELPLSINESHPNRSSLLLLEPLLLMPELARPRQQRQVAKNRITRSEHFKIVRMMIAYTLAFFLLAIITFYIVYFT